MEDTPPATLACDPPHIAPLPSDTLPAAPEANGASAVAEAQQPPVQILASSQLAVQAVAPAVPVPSVNGSTPDVGTQSSGRRRRSRVGGVFKRLFHRP